MQVITETNKLKQTEPDTHPAPGLVASSWSKISPAWPLKHLIAANPLAGFEDLPFRQALVEADAYFRQENLLKPMQTINLASIKWLQIYFDQGQATISIPLKEKGLLQSTLALVRFDKTILKDKKSARWLNNLPKSPHSIIIEALFYLGVPEKDQALFATLMLTTLPGWAAYIQYLANWTDKNATSLQEEYLALRLVLTCLIWSQAKQLCTWHKSNINQTKTDDLYHIIQTTEHDYQQGLIQKLAQQNPVTQQAREIEAQLVFCIDVRSEPFRRALEAQGPYQTFGFAGFFGVPASINDAVTGHTHASCPVLLKPAHTVTEHPSCNAKHAITGRRILQRIKQSYQSLKYNFASPFDLVDILGLASGLWMMINSAAPQRAAKIRRLLKKQLSLQYAVVTDLSDIPLQEQVKYAAGMLQAIGLTEQFASLVVLCGHGSSTQNNAFATALNCGACGGHHGGPNARVMASILNQEAIRQALKKQAIDIPTTTVFAAAEHNTTTDQVELFRQQLPMNLDKILNTLEADLAQAGQHNSLWRSTSMGVTTTLDKAQQATTARAQDWAELRPEWGLAKNAAFIVGPRWLTQDVDLEGRAFLHSYEWQKDSDLSALTGILTAPMIVAQWINAQYCFSTIDNIAFGAGSKITHNVTGKIGVMQGNASDLMHGLPLESVFQCNNQAYHQPARLTTVVYAPTSALDQIIRSQPRLQSLFANQWVHLICLNPQTHQHSQLRPDLTWQAEPFTPNE